MTAARRMNGLNLFMTKKYFTKNNGTDPVANIASCFDFNCRRHQQSASWGYADHEIFLRTVIIQGHRDDIAGSLAFNESVVGNGCIPV